MNCERAVELMTGPVEASKAGERQLAADHLGQCADCRHAVEAVHALRLASLAPVPAASAGAVARTLAAVRSTPAVRRPDGRFWLGMGLGAALAASLAFAVFLLVPAADPQLPATPRLELVLNQPQDVSISLSTPEALADAEIHVTLRGAVGIEGYADRRELQWRTNLDAGVNQLTLPVVATGREGGQVLVDVVHAGKRRSFLVDVTARV